jgi:hypothetical protein
MPTRSSKQNTITDEAIAAKLREIGLQGHVPLSVDELCAALRCSRSHAYAQLLGVGEDGKPLRLIRLSEKVGGTYARDLARLLIERERNPLPVRPRGARGRLTAKKKTAFSDEAAQSNRDSAARDSEMMAPRIPG